MEITRDKWRVQGCQDKVSTTRSVTLRLRAGGTANDLPHQLRVAGDLALVVVPGRPPLCLRCRRTGHIRRECRVPRCASCGRFGQDEGECVKTYASVAETVRGHDPSEHLMDAADAEEVVGGGADEPPSEATPTLPDLADGDGGSDSKEERGPALKVSPASSANVSQAVDKADDAPAGTELGEVMDTTGAVTKRPREDKAEGEQNTGETSTEEPPPKTTQSRRMSFIPKPNILQSRRSLATPLATPPS
ncbi:unnamed protein product [Ixodes pacificus]